MLPGLTTLPREASIAAEPNPEEREVVEEGAMSVRQACEFVGDSRTRLFQLMKAGVLKWFYAGTDRRITRKSLVEYLARAQSGKQAQSKTHAVSPKRLRLKKAVKSQEDDLHSVPPSSDDPMSSEEMLQQSQAMSPKAPSPWKSGAFGAKRGAFYLGISKRTFLAIASEERWPRKKIAGTIVYPQALIRAYLTACPDVDCVGEPI